MSETLKRKQVRINLSPEAEAQLKQLVEEIGSMSETAIVTTLVCSALQAVSENGNRIPLPLKFKLADDFSRLNESSKPKTSYSRK